MSVISRSTLALVLVAVVLSLPAGAAATSVPDGSSSPAATVAGDAVDAGAAASVAPVAPVALAAQTAQNGTTATSNGTTESNDSNATPGTAETTATTTSGSDGSTDVDRYDGVHASVGVEAAAVTDYTVHGTTYLDSIEVQSREDASAGGVVDVGPSLSGLSGLPGADLSVVSQSPASLRLRSGTGADLSVHDNEHGIVVVRADRGTQYVQANVTDGGEATYEGDSRVVVTTEDDRDASFTVVGNGSVGVNDDGNVVAELGTEGVLVLRAYHPKRTTADKRREAFISDGIATAEVYVMERPSGTVVDAIPYENDTTVNVTATTDSVNMTVDRSQRQGAIVFASVNGSVATDAGDLGVFVDGEAIPNANTFAQLSTAANNGQESRYMVSEGGDSESVADVAVAINHFSPREVSVRSVENGSNTTATTEPTTGGTESNAPLTPNATGTTGNATGNGTAGTPGGTSAESPGFGVLAALLALLAALAVTARRE